MACLINNECTIPAPWSRLQSAIHPPICNGAGRLCRVGRKPVEVTAGMDRRIEFLVASKIAIHEGRATSACPTSGGALPYYVAGEGYLLPATIIGWQSYYCEHTIVVSL